MICNLSIHWNAAWSRTHWFETGTSKNKRKIQANKYHYQSRASKEHKRRSSGCGRLSKTDSASHSLLTPETEGPEPSSALDDFTSPPDELIVSVFAWVSGMAPSEPDGCSEGIASDLLDWLETLSALSMMTPSKLSNYTTKKENMWVFQKGPAMQPIILHQLGFS